MLEVGCVTRSIAGHDKNKYYVIVALDRDFVLIADGRLRKLEKPKQKNIKHLSVTDIMINLDEITSNKALAKILEPMNQSLNKRYNKMGGN